MLRAIRIVFLCVCLQACASTPQTGVISARWTPRGGATTPVVISWDSEDDTHGKMFATLGRGGEHFRGHYVRVTAETHVNAVTAVVGGWGPIWSGYELGGPADPWWWGPAGAPVGYGGAYYSGFVEAYTGKVVATLFGDHGHSMRCRFTLVSPGSGLLGGGVGQCQTSDGGQLDAQF